MKKLYKVVFYQLFEAQKVFGGLRILGASSLRVHKQHPDENKIG